MILSKEIWDKFKIYLFIEKKQSLSNEEPFRYIFNKLVTYFSNIDLTKDNFNTFISEMRKNHKDSYLNSFIRVVKHLDKFLNLNEFKEYSLFPEGPMKELDVLTHQEILAMANLTIKYRINRDLINLRMKCLILLMGSVGCRISEALNLEWANVKSTYIVFKDTKNGQSRYVPILPQLYNSIQLLPKGGKVFQTWEQGVNRDLKVRRNLCNIHKEVYCHALRHAVITNLLKEGVTVPLVAKLVGHESWNSTAKYTHLVLDDVENMLYTYSPLWKEGQTFQMVSQRVRNTLQKMVVGYDLSFKETNNSLSISIKKN